MGHVDINSLNLFQFIGLILSQIWDCIYTPIHDIIKWNSPRQLLGAFLLFSLSGIYITLNYKVNMWLKKKGIFDWQKENEKYYEKLRKMKEEQDKKFFGD